MDLAQYRMQHLIVSTNSTPLVFPKIKDDQLIATLSKRINVWTNGQPFLTSIIYRYLNQYSAQIVQSDGAAIVDEIVFQKIIKNWRENEAATHLLAIEQDLLAHPLKDALLILYMRFLWLETLESNSQMPAQTQAYLQQVGQRSLLVKLGLIGFREDTQTCERGTQLGVANAIYAAVFSRDWIEAQLPGLTRAVSVVPLPSTADSFSEEVSASTGKLKLAALRLRYLSTFSRVRLIASLCLMTLSLATLAHAQTTKSSQVRSFVHRGTDRFSAQVASDKALFDEGMTHAENGRWLSVLQKFCQIPASSVYFTTAHQQLTQWTTLYPEAIEKANSGLRIKKNKPCGLAEKVLNSVEG